MESVVSFTALAVGLIIAFAALGAAVGLAILGGKFLESVARQPELASMLQVRMFLMAGLVDAVPFIGIGLAMFFVFDNPFVGQLVG